MIVAWWLLAGCREVESAVAQVRRMAVGAADKVTTPPMSCDAAVSTDPPVNCLSGTITCGQTIEGTTVGGGAHWNDDFYAGAFCFPAGDGRSGPERVYEFRAPAYADVRVRLQSDCVELDVAAIAWDYDGTCPGVNHPIPECEGDAKPGGGQLHLTSFKERGYLIAIEGKQGASGAFRLSVECGPLAGH